MYSGVLASLAAQLTRRKLKKISNVVPTEIECNNIDNVL